ncbi:unnamed protein product [Cuscuta campestris]|uniref:Beta-amylase n=1 Tax=Cuscuta campestris TaxID=132261 RepID=A0A484NC88_9ASTE|nr:unnamed protein product [Cuscuta campestris]
MLTVQSWFREIETGNQSDTLLRYHSYLNRQRQLDAVVDTSKRGQLPPLPNDSESPFPFRENDDAILLDIGMSSPPPLQIDPHGSCCCNSIQVSAVSPPFFDIRIPLPRWVREEMDKDPDLAYTDQWGRRNYEYVSLGRDTLPVLKGRTPVQCYSDFMRAFRDRFEDMLGDTIVEI